MTLPQELETLETVVSGHSQIEEHRVRFGRPREARSARLHGKWLRRLRARPVRLRPYASL
jgi:hypothetical protein